jgi:hypothetical protein
MSSLNRTIIGLKVPLHAKRHNEGSRLNRTIIGLKDFALASGATGAGSLNRTIIGLKGCMLEPVREIMSCLNQTIIGLKVSSSLRNLGQSKLKILSDTRYPFILYSTYSPACDVCDYVFRDIPADNNYIHALILASNIYQFYLIDFVICNSCYWYASSIDEALLSIIWY